MRTHRRTGTIYQIVATDAYTTEFIVITDPGGRMSMPTREFEKELRDGRWEAV